MTDAKAMMFICDDLSFAITGKINISGLFTSDIIIQENPTLLPQLVFLFAIDFPIEKGYTPVAIEISLPEEESPRRLDLASQQVISIPERNRRAMKLPFLLQQVSLRCGKIEAKIICDGGEVYAGRIWVNTPATFQEFLQRAEAYASAHAEGEN